MTEIKGQKGRRVFYYNMACIEEEGVRKCSILLHLESIEIPCYAVTGFQYKSE